MLDRAVDVLRRAGARFVYLHGSRAQGTSTPQSDFDLAASFGDKTPDEAGLQAALPEGCDLLILDRAPLELAGRVATAGRLLYEANPAERVEWEATTRKVFLDELPRLRQAALDFKVGAIERGRR